MLNKLLFACLFICTLGHAQTTINTDQNVITGKTDVRLLERNNGYRWFKENYAKYQPNLSAISVIQEMPSDIQIIVFAGTWCESSRELLPQFYRAIDLSGVSKQRVTLYFLDRDYKSPQGFENNFSINNTPVFILLQRNIEIGRITNTVNQSIEADIADLIPRKQ
jgi:hypothetical protein